MSTNLKELRAAVGRWSIWSRRLKKSIEAGLLAAALTALFLPAAAGAAGETAPVAGQTYYFDLSAKYDDIRCLENLSRGDINSHQLPDATLHYVPFTYAGAVTAYALPMDMGTISTQDNVAPYTSSRVLFLAEYPLSTQVSWRALNAKDLIFGADYAAGGVSYLLRAPSGGSDDGSSGIVPAANEWDELGGRGLIKNVSAIIVQDYAENNVTPDMRVVRGSRSSYSIFGGMNQINSMTTIGFRPVLEVRAADSASLKIVTLKLNGGSLHSSADDLKIAVKAGASFAAPASEGLTFPAGETALAWRGDDGRLYSVGTSIPSGVTTLSAEYGYAIVNTLTNIQSNNPSIYRSKSDAEDYAATLSPRNGYRLPDTLTVSVGGTTLSAGSAAYTYDKASGQLTVKASVIHGDVEIAASGVDVRKPELTGSAVRTSKLTATVTFTSDEAGV